MKSLNNIELKPGQRIAYALAQRGAIRLGTVLAVHEDHIFVQGDNSGKAGKLEFGERIAVIGNPTE